MLTDDGRYIHPVTRWSYHVLQVGACCGQTVAIVRDEYGDLWRVIVATGQFR